MQVRVIEEKDIQLVSKIHKQCFSRQSFSEDWIKCTISAFPRMLCYIVEKDEQYIGYIIWAQKSGFRPEVVLELEQIAIHPNFQNKGVGQFLIQESLDKVKKHLSLSNSKIKHIVVTTRADNYAQKLYKKVLGVKVEATINNLFSANEVFMIARNV